MRKAEPEFLRRYRQQAFTFRDVLSLIAVIALVACLMLPTLAKRRTRAQAAQCMANLGQMAEALDLYSSDNLQQLPPNFDGEPAGNWAYGDMSEPADRHDYQALLDPKRTVLARYLKGHAVFKCPSDRTDAVRSISLNCRVNPVRMEGEPRWLGGAGTNYPVFRRVPQFISPSLTFTVLDEDETMINDGYFAVDLSNTGDSYGQGTPIPLSVVDFPARRHSNGAGVAFVDEHVEIVRWKDAFVATDAFYPGLRVDPKSHDGKWLHEKAVGKQIYE